MEGTETSLMNSIKVLTAEGLKACSGVSFNGLYSHKAFNDVL